jgi:SAM-dependent methyltransferase
MSDALNNYVGWGWQRKSELLDIVYERTNGKVYQGPFKGMSIVRKFSWGDGDTAGKLLGIYENELYPAISHLTKTRDFDLVLNIGCAEGYYGLGLARNLPNSLCVLFDISPTAISISRENANINNLNNVQFNTDCSVENIRSYLKTGQRPFIIMDVEGHERVLLDLETIPELSKSTVIVESHDCNIPGTTELIVDRFKETHDVYTIPQGAKNPYIDILFDLCDSDKMLLCCESRPSTMTWIIMVPR